jgi:hypothetical protein
MPLLYHFACPSVSEGVDPELSPARDSPTSHSASPPRIPRISSGVSTRADPSTTRAKYDTGSS